MPTSARFLLSIGLCALGLAGVGCVPVVTPPVENPPDLDNPDDPVVLSFVGAVQRYDRATRQGWTELTCNEVAQAFIEVSDRVEDGLPEALFNAAMARGECADDEVARALLERANGSHRARSSESVPGFAPALVRQGVEALSRGELERARELFDQARQADAHSAEAYANLGALARAEGRWADAQLDLRRALAVDSTQMAAYGQLASLYLALAENDPSLLDITALVCQQAVERATRSRTAPDIVAPIHNLWGIALLRSGNVVPAVRQFERAVAQAPGLFEAQMNLGAVNISFRGYEAAAHAFAAATELRPESYEAHLSHGAALRGLTHHDGAAEAYQRARELDSSRPEAYFNQGLLLQDYVLAGTDGIEAQVGVLRAAAQSYRSFLERCVAHGGRCSRDGGSSGAEDLREAAERRITDCETMVAALSEAIEPATTMAPRN